MMNLLPMLRYFCIGLVIVVLIVPNIVSATDYSSSNFIIRDPLIGQATNDSNSTVSSPNSAVGVDEGVQAQGSKDSPLGSTDIAWIVILGTMLGGLTWLWRFVIDNHRKRSGSSK